MVSFMKKRLPWNVCLAGLGNRLSLNEVADLIIASIINIFSKDEKGNRTVFGEYN